MVSLRARKTHYSEAEAARALGITVEQLRALILHHIVDSEQDLRNIPRASFQPSDLLVLKLLSGLQNTPTTTR